jgi:DNA-directed RNA polymerase specialized sigma24 family protein
MTDSESNHKCRSALRSSAVSLRALRPVQRRSVEAELSARFAHEALPLRDILYRHAFRISRNHADAEDLVQETMMKCEARQDRDDRARG